MIPLALNRSDPEAAGLVACYVATPGGMLDLVSGTVGTPGGNASSRIATTGQLEASFDGAGDSYGFGTAGIVSHTDPFTCVWEAQLDSFNDAFPFITHNALTTGGTRRWRLNYSNDASFNDIAFGMVATSEAFRAVTMPGGISITGERHWGVVTFDGANTLADSSYSVWINGLACPFTTAGNAGTTTSENRIGGTSFTTTDWNGGIRQVRLYNRVWGEDEAQRFFDPRTRDSLFRLPNRRIYSFSAAAGGTTYDVSVSLAAVPGAAAARTVDYAAGVSVGVQVAAVDGVGADFGAALTLTVTQALTSAAGLDVSGAVALAVSGAVATDGAVDLGAVLALGHQLGAAVGVQWDAQAGVNLTAALTAALVAQGVLQAGLSLSAITAISQAGTVGTIVVSTPDGRVLRIRAEGRVLVIEQEPAQLVVRGEDRRLLH